MTSRSPGVPACLVVFGITGDLAKRKVLPAIYHLFKEGLFPDGTQIIGTSRQAITPEDLLKEVELCVLEIDNICDPAALQLFTENLHIVQLDPVKDADYDKLRDTLNAIDEAQGQKLSRLYYLSIPPQVYSSVIRHLGNHGLNSNGENGSGVSRLLVEKPFGYDVASAETLIAETATAFQEDQIFRIDHYLAKETAQNILAFRRHNPLFNSLWDAQHIRAVEVVATEEIGIEGRANFYDSVGALRDLVQSHLLQLLTITLMDLPSDDTDADQLHASKKTFLEAIAPITTEAVATHVVRAQYTGYRAEVNTEDSTTETFVSMEIFSNLPKWQGIPLKLVTGKALASKKTTVSIYFGTGESDINQLTFRIQPNEGIDVQLLVKTPGYEAALQSADMNFSYASTFPAGGQPDAYERVLVDAIRGDKALFATSEEVLASWKILQPILDAWSTSNNNGASDLRHYDPGASAASIIRR
jgi:glucose-6-phosphate 1-dehydrogenase